jgi:DNA polymerase-3 subunit alpha
MDTIEEDEDPTFLEQLIKYGNQDPVRKGYTPAKPFWGGQLHRPHPNPSPRSECPWEDITTCKHEKELLGFYLTSHPLDRFRLEIDAFCPQKLEELSDLQQFRGRDVVFCGMVKTSQGWSGSMAEQTLSAGSTGGLYRYLST